MQKVATQDAGRVCIIRMKGKLTIGEGDVLLRDAVRESLDKGASILLDMRELKFMDSSVIGEVVLSYKRAKEKDETLKLLIIPKSKAFDLLQLQKLDRAFDWYTDEEEALGSF